LQCSPPKTLDEGLKQRTQDYDGTRIYFPNSAGDPVGSGGTVLGDTLYWHNWRDYMHYESLNHLPEVRLSATVSPKSTVAAEIGKGNDMYTVTLSNNSSAPVVQTRIRAIGSATHEDVLPAFYSDNYFSLMPGESKTVTVEFNPKYLKSVRPVFEFSGWNTKVEIIDQSVNIQ
jgi:hypothetical protein